MKTQDIFIAQPKTLEQINALKAFLSALNINFEIKKGDEYDSEFVEKILNSQNQVKEGNVKRLKNEDLKEFLGL